jgi:hypothetical protein
MSLTKLLLAGHSRSQTNKIIKYIGLDPERFKELVKLFLSSEYKIAQRASWPIGICGEEHPELIKPYLAKLIDNLDKPIHDAVKRNTIRIFQFIEIPERLMGKLATKCFEYLSTPSEPIAVRVFAMTVLLNITKKQPELKNELKILIEDQLPYATAAFISRAKKTMKELNKIPDAGY